MNRDRMRCVVERGNGKWQAYCVDVDLRTEAHTARDARRALDRLLERYCYEREEGIAAERGICKPPLSRRLRYGLARVRGAGVDPDAEVVALASYVFRAPPQLLVGLA